VGLIFIFLLSSILGQLIYSYFMYRYLLINQIVHACTIFLIFRLNYFYNICYPQQFLLTQNHKF